MDSPHKERDLIGEDVDLDLLYLSLKWIQESWVGEEDSKLKRRSTMGKEREKQELQRSATQWGRRPLFIGGEEKWPLEMGRLFPAGRTSPGQPDESGRVKNTSKS